MSGVTTSLSAAAVAFGAAVSATVTYWIGRRKTSGTVATTEAETLWAEGQALRKELRDEVVDLRHQLEAARAEAAEAREEASKAKEEARLAKEEVFQLRKQLQYAQAELEDIHRTRMGQGDAP
jgi:uncharacterized protein (DUF3084 family)